MNGEIVIRISPDGTPEVEVVGVNGPKCKSLTEAIEKALGKTAHTEFKPEYHRQEKNNVAVNKS